MGRRAVRHTVEGYCIGPNYLNQRDALIKALEQDGAGKLVHPLLPQMQVMCDQYSVLESRERGGFCMFSMVFIEAGSSSDLQSGEQDTGANVNSQASSVEGNAAAALNRH